jgi:hypothetical protein
MIIGDGDEIKQYLDARYISAPEAHHRLYEFRMHEELPNVVRLQVHLENQQNVFFDPNNNPERALERAQKTQLLQFFKANADNVGNARELTFQEFPNHFAWDQKQRKWNHRKKKHLAIGRMYSIPPTAGERFFLRLLLTVVKGPTSFEHLRTVDREVCPTFKEACRLLGLLQDDREWRACLQDAKDMRTGSSLRSLFVIILTHCSPTDPRKLWDEFKDYICDDLPRRLPQLFPHIQARDGNASMEEAHDYGLYLIELLLHAHSMSLSVNFPSMPVSLMSWERHELDMNHLIREQLSYDPHQEQDQLNTNFAHFNDEQRHAFEQISDSVEHDRGKLFFLAAPGGCGKTFLSNTLTHRFRMEQKIVLCVASSGIASLLLIGGRTVHSRFKVPLKIAEDSVCTIKKQSPLADMLQKVSLIIWDEAPMQQKFVALAVSRTLQDICNNNKPFGGITTVFCGDWRQCLPVMPRRSRGEVVQACISSCAELWRDITILHLTQNMRLEATPEDQRFAEWLLEVGNGLHTSDDACITLPSQMVCEDATVDTLIDTIYPDVNQRQQDSYFADRALLSCRNADIKELNDIILSRFPGQLETFKAANGVQNEAGTTDPNAIPLETAYPPEVLAAMDTSGLPLSDLQLKKGAPIMILRNLDPSNGICNGTRAIILRATPRVLQVRLLTGDFAGQEMLIPRISMDTTDEDFPFILTRRQFPVRLAFAMTINKSQGQSMKHVGLDLRVPPFSHGQLYVALSRCTSSSRLKVLLPPEAGCKTLNIVYKEVLLQQR